MPPNYRPAISPGLLTNIKEFVEGHFILLFCVFWCLGLVWLYVSSQSSFSVCLFGCSSCQCSLQSLWLFGSSLLPSPWPMTRFLLPFRLFVAILWFHRFITNSLISIHYLTLCWAVTKAGPPSPSPPTLDAWFSPRFDCSLDQILPK